MPIKRQVVFSSKRITISVGNLYLIIVFITSGIAHVSGQVAHKGRKIQGRKIQGRKIQGRKIPLTLNKKLI